MTTTVPIGCGDGPEADISVWTLAERVRDGLPVSTAAHRDIATAATAAPDEDGLCRGCGATIAVEDGAMNIRDAIRDLSTRWIGAAYSRAIPVPRQVDHLIVLAFVNRIPEGDETALLREAYARLQKSHLAGEWP